LHVLGTPPAFILSQDQTRHSNFYKNLTLEIFCSYLDDLLILIDRLLVLVCFPYHSSVVQSTLDAFASGALFGIPSGASGIISLLRTLVKSFFLGFL
jgi:hypothetical protein